MKVVDHIDAFDKPDYAVVTIGTFDGVHVGHQTILKRVVDDARKNNGKSVLITFWPHPRFILNKDADKLKLLTTFEEKAELVKDLGVDYLLKIAFTPEFSNLSADEFVQQILVDKVGTKHLFIGYDHHFGNNREGNIQFLHAHADKYGFEVNEISRQEIDHIGISSTKIRDTLASGEIHLANSLLGRRFSIRGKVIDGNKRGRSIGYPTANIEVPEKYKLLPADGAYAIEASVDGEQYKGMLNIGFKPTVDGTKRTIEAHLFNFDEDIYQKDLIVEFVRCLRKEMKFSSIDELKNQLHKDKEAALNILE
ncbi:riboflavin kinase / FMN adenylyltransferase [Ekhidna lutea]|uniref:Riboflavin biosynthesis protein n=1 Tax=Ekhidna lutea TaxID=447679 RepID=A0A239LA14_EKHLU|nr:bifunctional riboflavin kinase/FAD synthetase [Ekhidna lutea]SNT26509.1 riboflavin kinase / FMN adenylyltransferase [Ekhidna lutea]